MLALAGEARVAMSKQRSASPFAGVKAPIARIVVLWLVSAATLMAVAALLDGVDVAGFGTALGVAAIVGLVNALVWPVLLRLALPLTVLTLGFGVVLLNGALVLLIAQIDTGLHVSSLAAGVFLTAAIAVVTTAVSSALAIDDEGFWYRNVLRRYGKRVAPALKTVCAGYGQSAAVRIGFFG